HRIENIIEIINQVTEIYNEANGIAVANVYSVRELTETERENIANSLKQQLKKKEVKLNNIIDPSVLGGLKIRVGNTIYEDRKSTRLNSSHVSISYAVFCLKKKNKTKKHNNRNKRKKYTHKIN